MRDDEFRKAVGDVRPLKQSRRADLRHPAPAPVAIQTRRDELAVLAESLEGPLADEEALETGEQLSYLRPGLRRDTLRKLRRAHWAIEDAVDLHGLSRAAAAATVAEFLNRCLARRLRCVRIVHGKGLGVLRAKLGKWLPRREEVMAFCQSPASEGGSGALLVLLRAKP